MEALLCTLSILAWIFGVLFLIAAVGSLFEGEGGVVILCLIIGILLCNGGRLLWKLSDGEPVEQVETTQSIYRYKVRELEKNTVFNITDTIGGFKANDSVWVNYSKLMVDPLDSVSMKCIILEEIK